MVDTEMKEDKIVRQPQDDPMFLINKESNTVIPLKHASFTVDINLGYSSIVLHQIYENERDHALETLFMMPYAENFFLSHIEVDFRLEDGTTKTLKTIVTEREIAQVKYNEAVATGKTAVLSYMQDTRQSKNMLRVMLGNFPARSKALLRAYCVQQLEFED